MPVDRASGLRVFCARTSSRDLSNSYLHVPLGASQTLEYSLSSVVVPTLFPLQPLFLIRAEVASLEIQI